MKSLTFQHIFILLPILALVGALIISKLTSCKSIDYTFEAFFESDKIIKNPYCGFYHIFRYTICDEYLPDDSYSYSCEISDYSESLALLEINLKNYRNAEISEKGLLQLNNILSAWANSQSGARLILRFLYDWDGVAKATEPSSLDLILKHIEQVSQAVNQYCDTVYIMQGAFIGNWGEMHHSEFSNLNSVNVLIHRLNELIHPSIYLSVRTPSLWRGVNGLYNPPKRSRSFCTKTSLANRLGLFNDGILGSETDLGTYGSTLKKDALSPDYKGTRKEELEFQNKLCRYVPNGGEVVCNNNLCGLETSVSALRAMHISYLNSDYDSRMFEKWKTLIWKETNAFKGCDGYTYIKAHLGYRYIINSCKIKKSGLIKPDYTLFLTIKNTGFSNTLRAFEAYIKLINAETGDCTLLPFSVDFVNLKSGNKKTFTEKLPVKTLKQGEYLIYFSVRDKTSGQLILLGNKNDVTENGYLLGRLKKN